MKKTSLAMLFMLSSFASQATVVFHEVDVQLTFWEAANGNAAGPLAVKGSAALGDTISQIKEMAMNTPGIKSVASMDFHFDYEVKHPNQFPEFQTFPAHGLAMQKGPIGDERIPEVLIYPESQRYYIEHHRVIDNQWVLIPFKLNREKVMDNKVEVVIRKNGVGSYSVFSNAKTEEIYSMLKPKAIFVYGVATDFCVDAAVKGFRERGYKTFVIEDAISGIFPELVEQKTKEMKAAGATFIKFKDVPDLVKQYNN